MLPLLFILAQHVVYTNRTPFGPTQEIRAEVQAPRPTPSAEVLAGLKARETPEWYGVPLRPTSASTGWRPWVDNPRLYALYTRPAVAWQGRARRPVGAWTGPAHGQLWPGLRVVPGPITPVWPASPRR